MKNILSFVFALSFFSAFAQNTWKKPNYKEIEKNCNEKSSRYFYDSLFQKFLKGDTNFTLDERQHLYYGFQFTSGYSPYGGVKYMDSLNQLLSQNKLTDNDYRLAIRYCDSLLAEDPMSLKILNLQTNLFKRTSDVQKVTINLSRMNNVIDAILSSGDGETASTAYYVICVGHEYSILNILGLEFGGSQSLKGSNDYLELKPNKLNLKGLYFDVTASLSNMGKMFKN